MCTGDKAVCRPMYSSETFYCAHQQHEIHFQLQLRNFILEKWNNSNFLTTMKAKSIYAFDISSEIMSNENRFDAYLKFRNADPNDTNVQCY
jgi:hypothetical protein